MLTKSAKYVELWKYWLAPTFPPFPEENGPEIRLRWRVCKCSLAVTIIRHEHKGWSEPFQVWSPSIPLRPWSSWSRWSPNPLYPAEPFNSLHPTTWVNQQKRKRKHVMHAAQQTESPCQQPANISNTDPSHFWPRLLTFLYIWSPSITFQAFEPYDYEEKAN